MDEMWGEKAGIRFLRPSDAARLRKMVEDPEVAHLLFEEVAGGLPSVLWLASAIWVQRMSGQPEFGIVDRTGRLIGAVRLWRISERNRSAMLTILIGEKGYWGKGYGTEALRLALDYAFFKMELNRVELHVFHFNQRAIRSYEKVGFKKEGLRRQALNRNGVYHDIWVMGLLRDEYLGARRLASALPASEEQKASP